MPTRKVRAFSDLGLEIQRSPPLSLSRSPNVFRLSPGDPFWPDDGTNHRHSVCSMDSTGSFTPPKERGFLASSQSESPSSNLNKRRISFHPNALLWAAVQHGDFDELFSLLAKNFEFSSNGRRCSVPESPLFRESSAEPPIDVNHANHRGITLLHLCCFAGSSKCVRLLLSLGADPNCRDEDRWTPLHAAATGGHVDVVRMLVDGGAKTWVVDVLGRRASSVTKYPEVQQNSGRNALKRQPVL